MWFRCLNEAVSSEAAFFMAHRETPERVVSYRLSNQIKSDMQSSSQLFPVALISAERRGDLVEDVYRLKPTPVSNWR